MISGEGIIASIRLSLIYDWLFSKSGSAGSEFKSNEGDDDEENIGRVLSKANDMESLPVKVLVQSWLSGGIFALNIEFLCIILLLGWNPNSCNWK